MDTKLITSSISRTEYSIEEGRRSPSFQLLQSTEDYLSNNQDFLNNQHFLVQHFGTLKWNFATLDVTNGDQYILGFPFMKDEKITGILILTNHINLVTEESDIQMNFVSVSTIENLISDNRINEISNYLHYALSKLNYLEFIRNNRIIHRYNNTLDKLSDFNSETISYRNFQVEYWVDGYYTDEFGNPVITSKKETLIIPCGQDSGGGTDGSEWGNDDSSDTDQDDFPPTDGSGDSSDNNGPGGGTSSDDSSGETDVSDPLEGADISVDCKNLLTNDAMEELAEIVNDQEFPCMTQIENMINEACDEINSQTNEDQTDNPLLSELDLDINLISGENISSTIGEIADVWANFIAGQGIDSDDCNASYLDDLEEIFMESECDLMGFSSAFASYFNITSSSEQSPAPTIGMGQNLCPGMINFSQCVGDNIHVWGGVRDFSFQYMANDNMIRTRHIPFFSFNMNSNISNCSQETQQTIFANAVNAAVTSVVQGVRFFASYQLYNQSITQQGELTEDAFLTAFKTNLENLLTGCDPNGFSLGASFSNNSALGDACNTNWVALNNNFIKP